MGTVGGLLTGELASFDLPRVNVLKEVLCTIESKEELLTQSGKAFTKTENKNLIIKS